MGDDFDEDGVEKKWRGMRRRGEELLCKEFLGYFNNYLF